MQEVIPSDGFTKMRSGNVKKENGDGGRTVTWAQEREGERLRHSEEKRVGDCVGWGGGRI